MSSPETGRSGRCPASSASASRVPANFWSAAVPPISWSQYILRSYSPYRSTEPPKSARTSPQRVLVFPIEHEADADGIAREAERQGLITEPGDLRLQFDVCPGAPACANATTDTRHDARRIAEAIQGPLSLSSLHVSGCEKGCARRSSAALTLVARDGLYDLICNDRPDAPPTLAGIKAAEIDAAVARFIVEHAS
jgi:precorrin-3B synthase